MKGIIAGVIVAFIFSAMMIGSIPLTLLYAKVHLWGIVEDYVYVNKARLALISLLSKTKDGRSYADIIVEKIVNGEKFDDLKMNELLEKMGFECYLLYIEEDGTMITEKECEEGEFMEAKTKVPLPELNYKTLVLKVGI